MKQKKTKDRTKYKSFWRLVGLTLNCGLSAFYYGFCITYFNSIPFRNIVAIYHLQSYSRATTEGLLTGCISFTAALGSIMAIFLVDKFSRRKCLTFFSIVAIAMSLLIMIPKLWVLVLVRVIQGLAIGAISCITPLYISEMMPKSVSGPFWSFHQCLYVFGMTFGFVLTLFCSSFMDPGTYWRIVFGFPIITSIIQVYNFIFVFPMESPKFLVLHGQEQRAKETLKYLYKDKYVDRVLRQIIEAAEYIDDSSSESSEDVLQTSKPKRKSQTAQPIQLKTVTKKIQNNISLNEQLLFHDEKQQQGQKRANNKIALFIALYLSVQQPFIGGLSVTQYSGDLIEGVFPHLQSVFPIIINIVGIFGSILSIYVLSKFGRRQIILFGSFTQAVYLFAILILWLFIDYQNPTATVFWMRVLITILFICVRVTLSTTYAPVSDLYTAQIVQPNILPLCSLCQWIMMGIVSTFFPVLCDLNDGNPAYAYAIFAIFTLFSFFVDYFTVLETKDKSEIQIRKEYDQKFPQNG